MTKPLLGVCIVVFLALAAGAQGPAFDVASVKPNVSGDVGGQFGVRPGGQLAVVNNSLRNIVRNAWGLQDFQIVGGPDWFDRDRFDITARPTVEPRTREEFAQMVQSLLADRFALRVHFETREIPIYALVPVRQGDTGPKLRSSATDCAAVEAAARRGGAPPPASAGERPLCGTRTTPGRMMAGGVTMATFARNLSNFAGRITVDRTGLPGIYDIDLEWLPDQLPPPGSLPAGLSPPPSDAPSLFTAVQEQLGLRLDSQRGPVEVLVIDSAERPTPD
jgi:uncharacterized protein (TIGR03435 family)